MMKSNVFVLVVSFMVMIGSICNANDFSLEKVKEAKTLRVGFCAQYPPFESYNDEMGGFEGFDVDFANALAKKLGVTAEFKDSEWQGLLGGLKKGDFDVIISCMSRNETRGDEVNLSDTYYKLPDVVVVRKDEKDIVDFASMKGTVIGTQMGSGSEVALDKINSHFKEVKKYNYNPEAFADLKFKRIDAVGVGLAHALIQIQKDSSYKIVGDPIAEAEVIVVVKKGSDELTKAINKAIASIKEDGTHAKMTKKWLQSDI